jgi:germination protein, Ger(x)C family
MAKKKICLLLSLVLLFPLSGCWSYHGLNEITIVSGVGIDFDPSVGNYLLTFEVVDTAQQEQVKSKIVEAQGKTIFDAVRNAKRRLVNKLYWGNTQVVVIGGDLAKQGGGVSSVVDWFISDAECRETVCVVVSEEKSACDLLKINGLDNSTISYEIKKILDYDKTDTSSVKSMPLYRIYDLLKSPGISLALPVFHVAQNEGEGAVEANGVAVFKGDRMVGSLNAEETKYFLFAVGGVDGGILTLYSSDPKKYDISLEISENKTQMSCSGSEAGGKIGVRIDTKTKVYLEEAKENTDLSKEETVEKIESRAGEMIEDRIRTIVQKVQKEYDSDIFGFGNLIYKNNPDVWKTVGPQWDKEFQNIDLQVNSEVEILNTAYLKHT